MNPEVLLSNLVKISGRFTRSVNLERDFFSSAGVDGYVLTTTSRTTLRRIAEGVTKKGGARAWTLTGPFGSGKSAFALYLANILTGNENARIALRTEEEKLYRSLFDSRTKTALPRGSFLPILATGARESVPTAILRGLIQGLRFMGTPEAAKLIPSVSEHLQDPEALGDRGLVELLEQVLYDLSTAQEVTGMVLVLDELGKHLEYAALNANSGDLYVLQSLAEMAQRSKQAPVIMVTLLHQSFERYAERLTSLERAEWSKVQGRFEDVAYQENLEQIVRLVADAIQFVGTDETAPIWYAQAEEVAATAERLRLRPSTANPDVFAKQLAGVYPLHPTVAFTLGPLFRRLAQNERSLFAFLSAHEPFGFQDFLLTTKFDVQVSTVYTIDRLYDYVVQAFGGGLYSTPSGRRWAEIETSLARLGEGETFHRRVIKAVGMLSVIGQFGNLKAGLETVSYALNEPIQNVTPIIQDLCERSVLIFRAFQEAYGLWEGSDFDLEEKLKEARVQVCLDESISSLLQREKPIRPLVARRHSIQTGTLRYFEVRYALVDELVEVASQSLGESDGAVILTFPTSASQRVAVGEFAKDIKDKPQFLLVEPESTPVLQGYLHDLSCLRWLTRNATELAGDSVARREIYARISEVQRTLKLFLDSLLDDTSNSGRWYHKGQTLRITCRRDLTSLLSEICDEVYSATPCIRNELVNRRHISTSAAAARNSLLDAILSNTAEKDLGFDGYPPARSIHEALFVSPGIYRKENERFGFYSPTEEADSGTRALWEKMERFLGSCEGTRRSVGELFTELQAPPFGLKIGCLPIYLCAFLIAKEAEAALYEENGFIPKLTLPHLERLIKTPQKFKIQRFRIAGVRSQVFEKFFATFKLRPGKKSRKGDVLNVVRPLCHFAANLPEYSQKTKQLSEAATKVRLALFKAQEPAKLLFETLPAACDLAPFTAEGEHHHVEEFFSRLRAALKELQASYDRLLEDIEHRFCQTFSLRGKGEEARQQFIDQAGRITKLAVDDHLKSFLLRASDDRLEIVGWIESIATVLVAKPPKGWNDKDRAVFEVNLRELARKYNQLEALAMEVEGDLLGLGGDEVLCIDVTDSTASHVQKVVRVPQRDSIRLKKLETVVEGLLAKELEDPDLRLALLAQLSKKLINAEDEHKPLLARRPTPEAYDQTLLFDDILADDT
jgi:hypothetical protein